MNPPASPAPGDMAPDRFVLQALVYGGLAFAAAKGRDALVSKPKITIWIGRAAGGRRRNQSCDDCWRSASPSTWPRA